MSEANVSKHEAVMRPLSELPDDAARAAALRRMCNSVLGALCEVMTQANAVGIEIGFRLGADETGRTVVQSFALSKRL